jgi:pseudaminic acid biosynthesis-associated methylase
MNNNLQLSNLWEQEFGVEYTMRKLKSHKTEKKLREPFWNNLIKMLPDIKSVLEIGCNAGMNLESISKAKSSLKITGLEPNEYALEQAVTKSKGKYNIIKGDIFDLQSELAADLVFTCTVLIHIAPQDLYKGMSQIFNSSNKYILSLEYYWPTLKEIEYRGQRNALWKQDFGALWIKNHNVNLIETGYLDAREGFDRLTWWLFEK